ncbi:MAG: glycosyltransferase, partial [Patescibacteria group bacterium]|nr:glycosyltransferase [Patescibacteria group bacterium]
TAGTRYVFCLICAFSPRLIIAFVQEGDILYPNTLFELVAKLNLEKSTYPDIIFSDHDYHADGQRLDPFFKPGWSPDLFLVNNYLMRACLLKRASVLAALDDSYYHILEAEIYNICLKISETGSIIHCPGVLFSFPKEKLESLETEEHEIRGQAIIRRGENAQIKQNTYLVPAVEREIDGNPRISIIIPTCFKNDYIITCLTSIISMSTYKNYEIIVLDNSRKDSKYGIEKLINFDCKIVYVDKLFNWAYLNNIGVKSASGDVYLFLNDDTEVIISDWLERLAAEAMRPQIGAVGPLLLFPDGKVQHAGLFLVNHGGGARHCFANLPEDFTGYHNLLHYQRNCIAVTGACLMVSRQKFEEMQGFDEELAVVGNDLDFCIRLWQKGYRNLYVPEVKLTHKELASRGKISEETDTTLIWDRWGRLLRSGDPYHNKYLSVEHTDYRLNHQLAIAEFAGNPSLSVTNIKRILLVKLDHIGDVVLSLPAIRKVRNMFPEAEITVLCAPWAKALLEMQPEIDHVKVFEYFDERSQNGVHEISEQELKQLESELKLKRYNLTIHLRRHEQTKPVALMARADYCLTYSSELEKETASHPLPMLVDRQELHPKWHISDQLRHLVNSIQCKNEFEQGLHLSSELEERADELMTSRIPQWREKLVVGIHPTVGSTTRQWPPHYFTALADMIIEDIDATIVLFGAKGDKEVTDNILSLMRHREQVTSFVGECSLIEFCGLVKKCDYFIGNNSGPMHISGIQNVATLGIFGGVVSAQEWAPLGTKTMIARKAMDCSPCYIAHQEQCSHNLACLNKLYPEEVFGAFRRLITVFSIDKHKKIFIN